MSDTSVAAALTIDQWQDKYFKAYVRDSRFKKYMGTTENSIFQIVMDLAKKKGDDITVQLVSALSGAGIAGDNTLEGNEEALSNYGHKITVAQIRNAVRRGEMEQQKTNIELLMAAETMLKLWSMADLRDTMIARMYSPNLDGTTTYAASSEANKNAWLAANGQGVATNRVLFGAALSNNAADDHATALANVDSSADTFSRAILGVAKRMAQGTAPIVRPIRVNEDEETYVCFTQRWAFRDLRDDMVTVLTSGDVRGKANKLFTAGDLFYDGVIVREIPEIAVISGVGASSIDVAPCFFCGAQALGVAWAQKPKAIFDEFDYGNLKGRGVAEIRGVEKLFFNSIQHGMATLYMSGVADT